MVSRMFLSRLLIFIFQSFVQLVKIFEVFMLNVKPLSLFLHILSYGFNEKFLSRIKTCDGLPARHGSGSVGRVVVRIVLPMTVAVPRNQNQNLNSTGQPVSVIANVPSDAPVNDPTGNGNAGYVVELLLHEPLATEGQLHVTCVPFRSMPGRHGPTGGGMGYKLNLFSGFLNPSLIFSTDSTFSI